MKRNTLFIFLIVFTLTSCTQRGCQQWKRNTQTSERDYDIKMYSGDSLVFQDHFHGIINQEEHSDGIYYFKGDTLIEVGGNYIIKSDK